MPYRELPKSDTSRLTALRRAKLRADSLTEKSEAIAFSDETLTALNVFYPLFKKEYDERQLALSAQTAATEELSTAIGKLKTLDADFLSVLNMAIGRGEIPASARPLYGLALDDATLPVLASIDSVLEWAGNIETGETARTADGGKPLDWPSAAQVTAAKETAETHRAAQADASSAHDKEQEDVANLRVEADALIRDIWDEVEFTYRKDDPASLRRKARLYGVYYATRPGETPEESDPEEEAEEPPLALGS